MTTYKVDDYVTLHMHGVESPVRVVSVTEGVVFIKSDGEIYCVDRASGKVVYDHYIKPLAPEDAELAKKQAVWAELLAETKLTIESALEFAPAWQLRAIIAVLKSTVLPEED